MGLRIYCGNLAYATTDEILREHFERYGQVTSASVIRDRESGRSKGFGFVEMAGDAQVAIEEINGSTLDGREIRVSEARPRQDRGGARGEERFRDERGGSGRERNGGRRERR